MAASQKQGAYLGITLAGFTAFPAGIVAGGGLGKVIAIVGAALLVYAVFGFYWLKDVPSVD